MTAFCTSVTTLELDL